MVSAGGVGGHRISTVVPSAVTGEAVTRELTNMDLAMRLHYIRGVYFFPASSAVAGLTILELKAPMFPLLSRYHHVAARLRASEEGRPFLKCNDSGLRIVEAACDVDLVSWLHQEKEVAREKELFPEQVIGPYLQFSPLVFIQFTRFRCGGLAVGFSWSHILGDASSASSFFIAWGEIFAGKQLPKHLEPSPAATEAHTSRKPAPTKEMPLSIKQVRPVENYWVASSDHRMETFSFRITESKLRMVEKAVSAGAFESISALIWQCLAKIRCSREPTVITVCRCIPPAKSCGQLGNHQMISTVALYSCHPSSMELAELVRVIKEEAREENKAIEGWIEGEGGAQEFVIYGANLTFVNMEEVGYYGLEVKGSKPIQVNYTIGGVGDGGVVLVCQDAGDCGGCNHERMVSVILPEEEIHSLRLELANAWGIA